MQFVYFGGDIFFKNSTTYPIFKYYKNISRDPPFPLFFLDGPPFKAIFLRDAPQIPPAPPFLVKNERSPRERIFFNFLVSTVCYFVLKITWGSIRGQRGKERGSFRGRYGDLFEAGISSEAFNTGRWPIFLYESHGTPTLYPCVPDRTSARIFGLNHSLL